MKRLLLTLIMSLLSVGCSDNDSKDAGKGNDTDSGSDAGGDDTDTATGGTGVTAVPFDYLNCISADEVPAQAPDGGMTVASDSSRNVYAKDDENTTVTEDEVAVEGQSFETALRITVAGTPANAWDIQIQQANFLPINTGDVLLVDLWARCEKTLNESNECETQLVIEDRETYAKIITFPIRPGKDWTHYYVAVESTQDFGAAGANFSIFGGFADQSVEIGPVTVNNYSDTKTVAELPATRVSYPGIDADADWRATAAERIDETRRGDMRIKVVDASGDPVPDAQVEVAMTKHAFLFGSAIDSGVISRADTAPEMPQYGDAIVELFNIVTAYNAFKWKPWAGDWGAGWSVERAVDTLDWALAQGLVFRGHVVIWPSWRHLPEYLEAMADDVEGLRDEISQRITEAMTAGKGKMLQWDVVNEPFDNHDLMDILGDEEMAEWFKQARAVDPDAKLFLNDYAILAGGAGDTGHRKNFEYWLNLLKDNDAPVDGIGLQSHFGLSLTGPEDVYALLDRYGTSFDKEVAITEYDIKVDDDDIAGCFTHDFMTAIFSHPKVSTFVMWGFQGEEDPIYDEEWNLRTSGQVYKDLVFKRWWTDETATTDDTGTATVRGYYGDYDISVTVNGETVTQSVTHTSQTPAAVEISI